MKHLQKKGHEIHYLANAYSGSTIEHVKLEGGEEFKFKIYGHGPTNPYFNQTMNQIIKKIMPDRFIILLDTFMLFPWFLNIDTSPAKTFFWYPSDGGGGMPKGCESILRKIDVPVAMSEFGRKQVKDYYNIISEHIPHGVNTKEFYPLPEEEKNKLKMMNNLQGKFVIGVVARNQPRKNLDRTIKAMRLIADNIPNAILYLHLDPADPAQQMFSIPELVKKFNLENRVIYSGMNAFQGFPQNQMNNVYNLMDCFLLTTSGEGFGIPIIEAMSAGIPVIATDYTTTPELIINNNSGLPIKLSGVENIEMFKELSKDYDIKSFDGTITGSWEVERGICSITDTAIKVLELYNNPVRSNEMGRNGRKACIEKYDFSIIGEQWEKVLA